MTRDVVVGGFDVGGFVDCGVEDGGFVDDWVMLGAVDDGVVVEVPGTDEVVDLPVETEGCELPDEGVFVGPEPDVITTDGVAVTGTKPVLVRSAAGSDEHADNTRPAAAITAAARLLKRVMNLPDHPRNSPRPSLLGLRDYRQRHDRARVVHRIHPGGPAATREIRPIV